MPLHNACTWLVVALGDVTRINPCNMPLDYVCMWLVVGIGALTGFGFHKKFRRMGFPMFGVFVLAADSRLYWAQCVVAFCLRRVGWWEGAAQHALWDPAWTVLPVVLFALLARWLVSESGKVKMSEGQPRAHQGSPASS